MNLKLSKFIPSERVIKNISIFTGITSLVTLLTISLFPLFSDEIQIRMWLSRLPYGFPTRVTGVARCFTAFSQIIPTSFYPAAAVNWLLHGLIESPTYLRFTGILILFFWISLLAVYSCLRMNHPNSLKIKNILFSSTVILSLLFIGMNPIFISINRSEQLYYPAFVFLLIICFNADQIKYLKYRILILILVLFLISIIFYGHPKSLFFLPFFFTAIFQVSKSNKLFKSIFISSSIILIYLSIDSFFSWSGAFKCPEIPEYQKFLSSFSFNPLSIFYDPLQFFETSYLSIRRFNEYLEHFEFKKDYVWNFLPSTKNFNSSYIFINLFIKFFLVIIYFYTLINILIRLIKIKSTRNYNLLLFSLLLSVSVWAVFNLTKNIYDASFFFTITCIVLIFFIIQNDLFSFKNSLSRIVIFLIFIITLLSQILFISNNLLPFIKGFTGPGIRIGLYEFQDIHNSIRRASDACDISPTNGKFIVIDDLTYGYFRKSYGPVSFTYNRVGTTKTPLQDLFRTVESDGMILDCNNMPERFRKNSTRSNNICCLSKSDIKRLFIDASNTELN